MKIKEKPKIRNCNYKSDLDYIISKMDDLYKANIGDEFNPTNKFKKDFKEAILKSKGKKSSKIFILELEKKQIGYIQILIKKSERIQKKSAVIARVYINQEHRKKGYGKLLIKEGIKFVKSRDIKTINLNSYKINTKFYEKMGF